MADNDNSTISQNGHKDNEQDTQSQDLNDSKITPEEKASDLKEHDVLEEEIVEAEKIKDAIAEEMAENDGWLKILGNDSLLKKIKKEGELNKRPLRGEICTVRFEGKLKMNEEVKFEISEKYTFQLGDAEVISGLDLSLPLMCKGEISTIQIAPRFGYGQKGLPPLVPPDSHLIYEVELIDFETEKELVELSVTERKEIGNRKRERGNWWYERDDTSTAVQCYRRALEFLDDSEGGISYPKNDDPNKDALTAEIKSMFADRLKTYNNMAAAQLKLKAYDAALNSVENVLRCEPKNVKALFRKAKILGEKGETEDSIRILKGLIEQEPNNNAFRKEIQALMVRRSKERESEKQLYQRMFKKDEAVETKGETKSGNKNPLSLGLVVGGVCIALAGVMAYRYRFI